MLNLKTSDLTLSEIVEVCKNRSCEAYAAYKETLLESDENAKDTAYKNWARLDDILIAATILINDINENDI